MSDLKDLIVAATEVRRQHEDFLLATVVRVRGASCCRSGARILLFEDRWIAGSVSGRGITRALVRRGWLQTRENEPVLVTYDSTRTDDVGWGLGLGCDGVFDVLLERIGRRTWSDPLAFIERCIRDQTRGSMATVFHSDLQGVDVGARICVLGEGFAESSGLPRALHQKVVQDCRRAIVSGRSAVQSYDESGGSVEVLVEAILPPPRLFLFAGHDACSSFGGACRVIHTAAAVANLARAVGWDVFVCVPQARAETRERFAPADAVVLTSTHDVGALIRESDRALAVVMSGNYVHDKEALALLTRSGVKYIGVLGPRDRTAKIIESLGEDIDREPRIHTPIGLAIAAETPEQVALATIAEAQSFISKEQMAAREEIDATAATRGPRSRDEHTHASPT